MLLSHVRDLRSLFFVVFSKLLEEQHKKRGVCGVCRSAFISLRTIAEVKKTKSKFLIKVLSCGRQLPKLENGEVQYEGWRSAIEICTHHKIS